MKYPATRGLNFGMHFNLHPYFVYASIEGYGKSAHIHKLACAFADAISTEILLTDPYVMLITLQTIVY